LWGRVVIHRADDLAILDQLTDTATQHYGPPARD
jgi:hypothetical protein